MQTAVNVQKPQHGAPRYKALKLAFCHTGVSHSLEGKVISIDEGTYEINPVVISTSSP